jgi:hypothetical protein
MTSLLSKTAPNYAQKQGTGNSFHIPQPFLNYGGLTKMMSSDYKYVPKEPTYQNIPQEKPDSSKQDFSNTLFQNEPKKEGEKTSDNPQDDDTIGFWLNNINSSNMYRSFIKGKNPWAKSSAFTQKIQNTRGAYLFYQNAFDSPLGGQQGLSAEEQRRREEELRKQQEEAERKAKEEAELQERIRGAQIGVGGVRNDTDTAKKILNGAIKKGWLGLRILKNFLKENNKVYSDIIDKNTFYLLIKKQGILLEEVDLESICDAYDVDKTDYFNFINFLNALRNVSNTRGSQIESFKEQVKAPGQNYISLSNLLRIADMNYHPEAIKFIRSVPDLRREYENILAKIAKEDVLSEDDFRQFFYDVSTCVANDADFTQILRALGYK